MLPQAQEPSWGRKARGRDVAAALGTASSAAFARLSQQMVLLAHISAEKFSQRKIVEKIELEKMWCWEWMQHRAHRDHGISHHCHFHPPAVHLVFFTVLLTAQFFYIDCLKVTGCIQGSKFVLTDRLTVLNACRPFFFFSPKSNVFYHLYILLRKH